MFTASYCSGTRECLYAEERPVKPRADVSTTRAWRRAARDYAGTRARAANCSGTGHSVSDRASYCHG